MLDFKKITQEALGHKNYPLAQKLCQDWIRDKPQDSEAYHTLGLIYAQTNRLDQAILNFNQAIETHPLEPSYHNNLGNAYLLINHLEKATLHLQEAIRLHPDYAQAYNHLGILSLKQNLFKEAESYFKKAIRTLPHFWEAHFNLANCLAKQDFMQQACEHYRAVLKYVPQHPQAQLNLGLALYDLLDYEACISFLAPALEQDTENLNALYCLGSAYLETGKVNHALATFARVIDLKPDHAKAHHNLGILNLRENQLDQALDCFQKSLRYDPHNPTASHMVNALQEITPKTPTPAGYIQKLFDQYAPYYNENMREKLAYQVPQLLRDAVGKILKKGYRVRKGLDLGCGTGLCGVFFRDVAHYLVGCDLSENMILQAKQLGAYDALCISDLTQCFPGENQGFFDLIILGDVLVYHGELSNLFARFTKTLTPKGLLCFNVEYTKQKQLHLQKTGRFAHPIRYIREIAQATDFSILSTQKTTLRQSRAEPLTGEIFVLSKGASDVL